LGCSGRTEVKGGDMEPQRLELETLAERLDRLERQHRGMKRAGFLFLIAGVFLLLGGSTPSPSQTIEARGFLIRDVAGKVRGRFGTIGEGVNGLELLDEEGKALLEIGVGPERIPKIVLHDDRSGGAVRVGIKGSAPYLELEARGTPRVFLSAAPDPLLKLLDEKGAQRAAMWVQSDGLPALRFYGADGKERLILGMQNTLESFVDTGMFLMDEAGHSRASLVMGGGFYPSLRMLDKDLKASLLLNVAQGSASLHISDKEGKVIWSAPEETEVAPARR